MKYNMNFSKKSLFFLLLILFIFTSCNAPYQYYRTEGGTSHGNSQTSIFNPKELSEFQKRVVQIAKDAEHQTNFVVDGRRYNMDCSGFVMYVLHKAGLDVLSYNITGGNGVEILYKFGKKHFSTSTRSAKPGDVVIFENTYDKSGSNRMDDLFTHAGIIIDFDPVTKIYTYVHIASTGYDVGFMSLEKPLVFRDGDLQYNSWLRRRDPHMTVSPPEYLSGNLFQVFVNFNN